MTISAGVACWQPAGKGLDATDVPPLMHQADTALYTAKKLGRNQVQHYVPHDE